MSAADYASKLHLMNGDTEVENVTPTVTDNGDNTYTVTYSNLPKYADGAAIAYSVKEDNIDGYTADAEMVEAGGTLTNIHKVTSSTTSSDTSSTTSSDTNSTTSSTTGSTASSSGTSSTAGSTASSNGNGTAAGGTGTTGTGSPKTGDSSALELYGALAAVSAAVLLILLGLRRRRKA